MKNLNIPELNIPRIVILGGGFAGLKIARTINSKKFQVVLLDQNNYHIFQPLLYQVATAGLEPDSIASPLRKILRNKKHTHIRMAKVLRINAGAGQVETDIGPLHYDHLVIATGAKTNYFGMENVQRNAMPMKSLDESLDLRSLIFQDLEEALRLNDLEEIDALLNIVIVGGGPTGVELAGALAELKKHVLPRDYPDLDIRRMQIHLIEASPRLLNTMSQKASTKAEEYLRGMDVNVWTDLVVKDQQDDLLLTSGRQFRSHNVIWAAGVMGNIPSGLGDGSIDKGRIIVDANTLVEGYSNIYAVGDVALMKTEEFPNGLPMLGSVAQQQGVYLAKHLLEKLNGSVTRSFRYKDRGTMATVGRNKAVVDMGGSTYVGFLAWATWLFVHLMLLIDFRNRIVVLANWIWSYIKYDRGTRLIIRRFERNKKRVDKDDGSA